MHFGFLLSCFRARLSEVSHGLAVQGPSLSEESVDNLSLSSSYASSLSSSCSSLTTLMRTNGSLRGSRRRKVTWTNEVGQTGEVVVTMTDGDGQHSKSDNSLHPPPPPYAKISSKRFHLQRQKATLDQPPSSPESDNTSSPLSSKENNYPHVQYDRSKQPGRLDHLKQQWSSSESNSYEPSSKADGSDTDAKDGAKCDVAMATGVTSGMVQGGGGVDLLVSSQSQNCVNNIMLHSRTYNDTNTVSKPDRTQTLKDNSKSMQRTKSESDMPVRNSDDKLSARVGSKPHVRTLSADEALQRCPSPPTPYKKDSKSGNIDQSKDEHDRLTDSSEDENDPFGSRNVLAMQEAMNHLRPIPIVEKIGDSTENLHQMFSRHLPPHKYNMITNVPEYRRKVLRTNGEKAQNMKPGNIENVVSPPLDFADKRGQTLKRLNSDSSMSSTSSNATWSESDPQESPSPDGPRKRAGILNTGKKSGDGKKSKSDKHITFALGTDLGEKDSNRKSAISKRRDLSPIYETPDLLRLSRNGSSAPRQNILTRTEANRIATSNGGSNKSDSGKTLEERLYRLFSYSSDDDNESNYSEDSMDRGGGGHIARKDQHKPGMKIPAGLVS